MYSKILVPLDGSELSECSLQQLEKVEAKGGGTEVILLKVVEPIMSNDATAWAQAGYSPVEVENRSRADAAGYVSQLAEKLVNQGIRARGETLFGRPAESILGYAAENQADLILMSSHGRTGISRWAFGSVADRVVRSSKVPVLLVSAPGCRVDHQQT
jgi:nucleotide-binding universal stress UspA family protein